jgi:hypothetical protein
VKLGKVAFSKKGPDDLQPPDPTFESIAIEFFTPKLMDYLANLKSMEENEKDREEGKGWDTRS